MSRRDPTVFAEFVAARSTSLYRTAYLMVGEHALAQDLMQEALTKTYVAWPRLREVSNAEAYTRRAITNTAISWSRKKSWHERPTETLPDREVVSGGDELGTRDWLWRELRVVTEAGGATAFAALLSGAYRPRPGERVGIIVCGANTDPATFAKESP